LCDKINRTKELIRSIVLKMAYWFHRNPLKATASVTFELRGAATNGQAQKICRSVGGFSLTKN